MTVSPPPIDPHALLEWYAESGVTTAEGEVTSNLYDWPDQGFPAKRPISSERAAAISSSPAPAPRQPRLDQQMAPLSPDEAAALATQVSANANSIEELDHIIRDFEGCPLKPGAKNTVIYDGTPGADLLIIGEAPGRDEDRIGKPFVGRAGILLDKMLNAIHLSRQSTDDLGDVCITNAVYWRPPGNRNPTKAEISICLPFVKRFIDLSTPKLILTTGNVSTQALYPDAPGITRARGAWRDWPDGQGGQIPVLPIFHPAFLLRQPLQKRLAWADLLMVKERLTALSN